MRRRAATIAVGLLVPLALGACAERERTKASDKARPVALPPIQPTVVPTTPPAPPPTTPAPPAPDPGGAASPTATPAPDGGGGGSGEGVLSVGTADNKFNPVDLTLAKGKDGKYSFLARSEGAPHTWQSDTAKFDSGNVDAGAEKQISFTAKPGTYDYYCLYHKTLGMVGKITLK